MENRKVLLSDKIICGVDIIVGLFLSMRALLFIRSFLVSNHSLFESVFFILIQFIQVAVGILFITGGLAILRPKLLWRKLNLGLSIFGLLSTPFLYVVQLYDSEAERLRSVTIYPIVIFFTIFLYFVWTTVYLTRKK